MAATSLLQGIGPLDRIPSQAAHEKHVRQAVKKVSWAPETNLRQVRLFLAEDTPFQSGLNDQDHLQAKRSWLWHGDGSGSEGYVPPGYGNSCRKQHIRGDAIVPQATWCCPPRFVIDDAWQVVAGDESIEVDAQNKREVRNLEAMYPRPSAIPPSPAEPQEPQENCDNIETPIIPLIPIEDDESEYLDELPPDQDPCKLGRSLQEPFNTTTDINEMQLGSRGMTSHHGNSATMCHFPVDQERHASLSISDPATELGMSAAATAAFLAVTRSNEKECMIDQDLLIKIFSDPQMIETLAFQHRKNNHTSMPISEPINSTHNGSIATCNVDQSQNPLAISRPQGACQVATSGIVGSTRSDLMKSEIATPNFQGSLDLCNVEAKTSGTSVTSIAQTTVVPVALPFALPHTSLHLLSRPCTISATPNMAVCQPLKGISTTAPTVSKVHNQSSFPDEQYYRDLIQKHGVQNANEQQKHQHGHQYYKELIQQHGGVQNFGEDKMLRSSQIHFSTDGAGGNYANNERSCIEPNRSMFRKPCLYFNTPNGCRHGASCIFLHDSDRSRLDASDLQHSKRAKAETEGPEGN